MKKVSDLSYSLFFNGKRGIEVLKFFKKKKLNIFKVFIAEKNLNPEILELIPKGIKFKIIKRLNTTLHEPLKKTDIALSCGFPLIFNKSLIKKPKISFLNCHAGILPKYRGGSPLNWQMINCEKKFGLSVTKINEKIDQGDIYSERTFFIKKKFNINHLHDIANNNFPEMILESVKKILSNELPKVQTKGGKVWRQRNSNDSKFKFKTKTFFEADRFIKALQAPFPKAFIYIKRKKIEINKIKRVNKKLKPGEIVLKSKAILLGLKDATIITKVN